MQEKRKKTAAFIIFAAVIAVLAAVSVIVGKKLIEYAAEPEKFRDLVDQNALFSRAVYIGITLLQVIIAFIPGEPLEILGGYAFGAVEGTLLFLISSTLGSVIIFLLVRRFGMRFAEIFFTKEKLQSLNFLKSSSKKNYLFFIIYALPGTPKDLLSYFAGLTDMKLSAWLFICTVGRLPSLITSIIGGSALGTKNYASAIIVFAATAVISGTGLLLYNKISKKKGNDQTKRRKAAKRKAR